MPLNTTGKTIKQNIVCGALELETTTLLESDGFLIQIYFVDLKCIYMSFLHLTVLAIETEIGVCLDIPPQLQLGVDCHMALMISRYTDIPNSHVRTCRLGIRGPETHQGDS